MPTYNTKWFQNSMAGAPVLSGQAGALIAVLNACLVDGFNLLTLDSLVVASNVATGSKASHGYQLHQIIEIAGATPAGLNGQWRVTSVTTNSFTFATAGISDQTATGTITAKTPGCGWEKAFTGTNIVVYRPTSAQACGNHAVRVTDTGTTTATCLAAEDWTDVSTPVNSIRTFYLPKSATADATARSWNIIADDRTVYTAISFTGGKRDVHSWGDFSSFLAGDGHAFMVRAPISASVANLGHNSSLGYAALWGNSLDQFGTASRSYSQVLGPTPLRQMSMCAAGYEASADVPATNFYFNFTDQAAKLFKLSASHGYCTSTTVITYSAGYGIQGPSPIDGGLHFVPVFQVEGESALNYRIRGKTRGLLHIMETRPLAVDVLVLAGVEGVADGLVMGFRTQNATYAWTASTFIYPETHIAIDLGNWG